MHPSYCIPVPHAQLIETLLKARKTEMSDDALLLRPDQRKPEAVIREMKAKARSLRLGGRRRGERKGGQGRGKVEGEGGGKRGKGKDERKGGRRQGRE